MNHEKAPLILTLVNEKKIDELYEEHKLAAERVEELNNAPSPVPVYQINMRSAAQRSVPDHYDAVLWRAHQHYRANEAAYRILAHRLMEEDLHLRSA